MPDEFYTWVIVGDPTEASLINNIPNLNAGRPLPPKNQVDNYLFELRVDGSKRPVLMATTAAKKWLFEEAERSVPFRRGSNLWAEPDEFILASFLPRHEIEQLWGKTCSYDGNRFYQFLPVLFEHSCPYQHRLLALRYIGKTLPANTEPMGIAMPVVEDKDKNHIKANLWPHLIRISLSAAQTKFLFAIDERTGIDPASKLGVNATQRSLFLPPVRKIAAQPQNPLESDSYFSPIRNEIRMALFEKSGTLLRTPAFENLPRAFPPPMHRDAPVNMHAVYVMDNPLVRDILLDGGSLSVSGSEGQPTKVSLSFVASDVGPDAYRRRFFQQTSNDFVIGPPQLQPLRRELQKDLTGLLPNGLDITTINPASASEAWECKFDQKYRDTGDPNSGVCESLENIAQLIEEKETGRGNMLFPLGDSLKKVFTRLVIDEAAKTGQRTSADNDLAEKLFITHLWRYPSGAEVRLDWRHESPEHQGWRWALVEQLLEPAFSRDKLLLQPRERLKNDTKRGDIELEMRGETWNLETRKSQSEADLWKWRFLLPLGSILAAKTLVLNDSTRSRLNFGYRLA